MPIDPTKIECWRLLLKSRPEEMAVPGSYAARAATGAFCRSARDAVAALLREREEALALLRDAHDALTEARTRVGGTALGSDVLDTAGRLAAFLALAVQR